MGHLAEAPLSRYAVVIRAADGTLLARSGASTDWQLLIPGGVKSKTHARRRRSSGGMPTLAFKKDRKG